MDLVIFRPQCIDSGYFVSATPHIQFENKELFIRFTTRAFRKPLSLYVFSYFPFGYGDRTWDLLVSVPDHCLSFYFIHLSFLNFSRFLYGLKLCMWFGYNPCINVCYFFHFVNFSDLKFYESVSKVGTV